MISVTKLLRRNNIKIKDFVGNKITLFDNDDIEKAKTLLPKNKIDFNINGKIITIKNSEISEETTSADVGSDVVVKCKRKHIRKDVEGEEEGVKKKNNKNSILGSDVYKIIQKRIQARLAETLDYKEILSLFSSIDSVDLVGKTVNIVGKDIENEEITKSYDFSTTSAAEKGFKLIKGVCDLV